MTFTLFFVLSLSVAMVVAGLPVCALIVLALADLGIITNWCLNVERINDDE